MTRGQMDQKKIEARMKLRKLELEAYSSLINAFRAQGNFTKEKKRILLELRSYLSISIERHQAEIRRSVNDDKLSKISSNLNDEDKIDGWVIEGRRVIPLLKRMAPITGVSAVADKVARFQVQQNQLKRSSVNNSFESQVDEIVSSNTNQEMNRKRLNSSGSLDSVGSKRKYLASDKSKNIQLIGKSPVLSSCDTLRNENPISTTVSNLVLNDKQSKQPKLLIMSTSGSVIANKSINHPINPIHSLSHEQPSISSNHQLTDNRNEFDEMKLLNKSSSNVSDSVNHIITTSSSTAKIYNPKVQTTHTSPKLMILPSNNTIAGQQTKTLTIPISHNVKPAQNSTILYSTQQQPMVSSTGLNCAGTLKAMPGITIQAIKTQSGIKSNNFIIMPNKASNSSTSTQAKGLLRQMNAKEFPLKFITTTPSPQPKDPSNDKIDLIDPMNQPTIILTNVSKETANSLAAAGSASIGNLIKNQNLSTHPNIIKGIKVIPKCQASTNLAPNQLSAARLVNQKTASTNQKAITIPATFMEKIFKSIPINRIASPNDQLKNTISITQNPKVFQTISSTSNANSSFTKTSVLKIPPNSTTESITKLIFSNVIASAGQPTATACSSKIISTYAPTTSRTETKKITLITKNSGSPEHATIESQVNDNEQTTATKMDIETSLDQHGDVLKSVRKNESRTDEKTIQEMCKDSEIDSISNATRKDNATTESS